MCHSVFIVKTDACLRRTEALLCAGVAFVRGISAVERCRKESIMVYSHWELFGRTFLLSWCLLLCITMAGGNAQASPSDVRGSGNVAVKGYTNSAGSFIMWSNGRITSLDGKEVNKESAYDSYSAAKLPTRISGHILGAPQVAVGSFSDEQATYVVFSDGSVKKPRNSDAASPARQGRRIVCGVDVIDGDSKSGPLGWACRHTHLEPNKWKESTGNVMEIVFNKPFKSRPVFLYSVDNYLTYKYTTVTVRTINEGGVNCIVSSSKVYIVGPRNTYTVSGAQLPWHVTFVAFEDE